MTAQNYYTPSDTPDYEFCKTPKAIFKSKRLKKLSDGAKLLYILILNRLTLSIKNGLKDELGRTIVYYSIEDVCEDLGCSRPKAVKLFSELDIKKGAGLIDRKRLGLCKTSIIFVLKPEFDKTRYNDKEKNDSVTENSPDTLTDENIENPHGEDIFFGSDSDNVIPEVKEENLRSINNKTSGISETENQEVKELERNNNKINKNNLNNNYLNNNKINLSISQDSIKNTDDLNFSDGWNERAEEYKKIIHKNISYETLVHSLRREWLDEIVSVMTDVLCSGACVKINNIVYPHEAVKERLLSLESDHIEYVWECVKGVSVPLKNVRAYMLTSLYRAPETMISWYEARGRSEG